MFPDNAYAADERTTLQEPLPKVQVPFTLRGNLFPYSSGHLPDLNLQNYYY